MAVREARWDCGYCGSKGVLGRHKSCPVCTAVREEGVKFYLPDDADEVSDVELLGYAQKGPDWVCGACSNSNHADAQVCVHCQSPRDAETAVQQTKRYEVGEAPTSGDLSFDEPEPITASSSLASKPSASPLSGMTSSLSSRKMLMGILALFLLCSAFVLFRSCSSSDVVATVQGFEWERAVEVEALQTFTEEEWELPAEARLLSQQEAIHHYDQVLAGYETLSREVSEEVQVGSESYVCGQRDLGNGFFEDEYCDRPIYETQFRTETYEEPIYNQVPVYQTQYRYEIDRWVVVRTEESAGGNRTAVWPELGLKAMEREGAQTERYEIVFLADDGERYRLPYGYDEWLSFSESEQVTLVIDGWGELQEVVR